MELRYRLIPLSSRRRIWHRTALLCRRECVKFNTLSVAVAKMWFCNFHYFCKTYKTNVNSNVCVLTRVHTYMQPVACVWYLCRARLIYGTTIEMKRLQRLIYQFDSLKNFNCHHFVDRQRSCQTFLLLVVHTQVEACRSVKNSSRSKLTET